LFNKEILLFNDEITHAHISQWRRESLRQLLTDMKRKLMELEKADNKNLITKAFEQCKDILVKYPDRKCLIGNFQMGSDTKQLSVIVNQIRTVSPDVAIMLFSLDTNTNKFVCLANVPDAQTKTHLKANEWVQKVISESNGKGGGKETQAQATNCDVEHLDHCLKLAEDFALMKLNSS